MMRALDATLRGAILESGEQPAVDDEDMYFLWADEKRYFVRGRVLAVGPRGYRMAFVDPSPEFLDVWGRVVLSEASRMNTRNPGPQNTKRITPRDAT